LSMCEMAVICISEFLKIRIFGLANFHQAVKMNITVDAR